MSEEDEELLNFVRTFIPNLENDQDLPDFDDITDIPDITSIEELFHQKTRFLVKPIIQLSTLFVATYSIVGITMPL